MIVDEELELTTESALLREVAEALHDLAADAESAECEQYEEEFTKEGKNND